MSDRTDQAAAWVYEGIWGALTRFFRVPRQPPTLPPAHSEKIDSFRPCAAFLSYLKFPFWLGLTIIDGAICIGWIILVIFHPKSALLLLPVFLAVAIIPDIIAYVALHLRYDTTWYVMSDRSLRIRRGIWTIVESTISFENIQNVKLSQGPLQRYFGFANLTVETAGGGAGQSHPHSHRNASAHVGLLEGLSDANRIRDLIMARVRASRSAGLGDERADETDSPHRAAAVWSSTHLSLLREIRDEFGRLAEESAQSK